MKGYKAFNKGLVCLGKHYAENAVFEEENAIVCKKGMHFCENPLDTLDYYPLIDDEGNVTEFAEVEALDKVKTNDNKKFCTKRLKIGTKINLSQFIKASFNTLVNNIKSQVAVEISDNTELVCDSFTNVGDSFIKLIDDDYASLTGGYDAKLIGGNYVKAVGNHNAIIIGDYGAKLVGNNDAKLIGGTRAKLISGDGSNLVGGNFSHLVGGDDSNLMGDGCSKLVGGNNAKLIGDYDTILAGGKNTIIVGDTGSIAKGKKGSIIVLVERDDNLNIVDFKAVQVDGEKIKEDVLYKLENGELIQV
jgi:hypothetical protein|nr:MAG TPA: hypothetical protein [Caudoviricetes sp.]